MKKCYFISYSWSEGVNHGFGNIGWRTMSHLVNDELVDFIKTSGSETRKIYDKDRVQVVILNIIPMEAEEYKAFFGIQ